MITYLNLKYKKIINQKVIKIFENLFQLVKLERYGYQINLKNNNFLFRKFGSHCPFRVAGHI